MVIPPAPIQPQGVPSPSPLGLPSGGSGSQPGQVVAPKPPQGVLVRGHAGRVINELSTGGHHGVGGGRGAVGQHDAAGADTLPLNLEPVTQNPEH